MTDPSPASTAPDARATPDDPATRSRSGKGTPKVRPEVWGRRRWLHRTLVSIVSTLLVIVLVATGLVVWSVRRAYPQLGGELTLPGLSAPVTVYRDQYGIPQIYADTLPDLFRAQGFVHAQDRFWEMDFRRHVTSGRLAELFGEDQVSTDAFLRTLGWRRVAEQEWARLPGELREYLEAYADGVNAWIDQTGGAEPSGAKSLEYTVLGLLNGDYTVEPWSPIEALAWFKAMAWDLRGNMEDEITRAVLLASGLTREQVEDLYPEYPYDEHQPIVDDEPWRSEPADPAATGPTAGVVPGPVVEAAPALAALSDAVETLPELLGRAGIGIGSNSWVVSGEHTASGAPLLANDPHLGPSMPGIWYQVGLHCSCGYNAEGFSFSGSPGIVIGHNGQIAWGFTNLSPDVTDLYLEKIDGNQYFDGEEWVPITTREEVIEVANGEPVTVTVRSTRHGPLLSDRSQEMLTVAVQPPVDPSGMPVPSVVVPQPTPSLDGAAAGVPEPAQEAPYAVALRWTALDPGRTAEALFALNTATGWESFREAAALFEVPSQNLLYADVEGNIGYQAPGRIPVRGEGDGRWPAPGWDPAYDWDGYLPFEELPSVFNPDEGWIVTANQAVVGPAYPHRLTDDWSYGFRSQRIRDMIADRIDAGPIDAEVIRQMQFDNHNGLAPDLVGAVRGLADRPAAAELLLDWDFQQAEDSAGAALYNVFWRNLLTRTFDELPEDRQADGGDRWWTVVQGLLDEPRSPWWDDAGTPAVETRDQILSLALADAVAELSSLQGSDSSEWRWGDLHTIELVNATFGTSGVAPIEWLFNRGPHPASGGDSTVNATSWDARDGYQIDWVPSMRMIVDLSNLDNSRWVQLTGNSGHAFHPNYDDQFALWRVGDNLPMPWARPTIEAAATDTLTLRP